MRALAAAGFQAIAVDPPGIGDSDKPRDGYDTGSIAVMLHTMMTQLGHSRYRLVGHDVGMWIGYAMASDFPQAVERLVLTEAVILVLLRHRRFLSRRRRTFFCGTSCSIS
jgi:pimeloyl-ACP methyl ester carboxylesterase